MEKKINELDTTLKNKKKMFDNSNAYPFSGSLDQ